MSSEKLLCECGSLEAPHNFRHPYTPARPNRKMWIAEDSTYVCLDANHFPAEKDVRCSAPQCALSESLHKTIFSEQTRKSLEKEGVKFHEFTPKERISRKVTFYLPGCVLCGRCKKALSDHDGEKHSFLAKIKIKNRSEMDIIRPLDPLGEELRHDLI